MSFFSIVFLTVVVASACAAPQIPTSDPKPAFAIPTEDLAYIIKVRNGESITQPKNLSPCARAILGCCKDNVINSHCSENLKCGAFFFDVNPCDDKFVEDALKAAKSFYEQFNKVVT